MLFLSSQDTFVCEAVEIHIVNRWERDRETERGKDQPEIKLDISLLALLGRNIIRKALAPVNASRKKETNENIDECLQQNRFNLLNVPNIIFLQSNLRK
jgi:hypothetical protein